MSRLTQIPRVEVSVNLELTMAEVQALDALAGYGSKAFLKVFYEHMGQAYLKPHEKGLVSLFATIQENLPAIINRYNNARRAFVLDNPVIRSKEDHDELTARLVAKAPTGTSQEKQHG
mgnify:CR=1 FL=1